MATVGELVKAKEITPADLDAAVETFIASPWDNGVHALGKLHSLNLAEAVAAHAWSAAVQADPKATEPQKRNAVRTAILLATPIAAGR